MDMSNMMAAIANKIYESTMMRMPETDAGRSEMTQKISGVDWSRYADFFRERRADIGTWEREDAEITTFDGLHLVGSFFPNGTGCKKTVIAFHGYGSDGISTNLGISAFFRKEGFAMLLPDARAHGRSEGDYIGFGVLDRRDAQEWIKWAAERCGEDAEIWLCGQSMGGATVLMASSLELPPQVKGIISDCGFTSPRKILGSLFAKMAPFPPDMILDLIDGISRERGGFGLSDCDSAGEVKKAKLPILFIHGSEDPFVPVSMCEEIYANCASPKRKVIFEGAAHGESYYADTERYEKELRSFISEYSK